jgi:hypothetical protein
LIHFPWNPYFVDHICRMRVIPYADTYRLGFVAGDPPNLLNDC